MKKLLLAFLLLSQFVSAQTPDATIKTNTNTWIRTAPIITGANEATLFDQETNSKLSRLEGYTAAGTNTYAATISWITAYQTNQTVLIKFTNANTGAATLNINGLGAKAIKKSASAALVSGDIAAGQALWLWYDGTNFQLLGGSGGIGLSSFSATSPLSYNSGTGAFSFPSWPSNSSGVLTNNGSGTLSWGTGGTVAHANNGLTLSGDTVQWGGTDLTHDVVIHGNKNVELSNRSFYISDVLQKSSVSGGLGYVELDSQDSLGIHEGDINLTGFSGGEFLIKHKNIPLRISDGSVDQIVIDISGNIKIIPNGTAGTNGKVLTSDASGYASWQTPSSGVTTFVALTDGPGSFTGKTLNYNRVNAGETALEYRTPSQVLSDIGGENALTFGDALTRTTNTINFGGSLTANRAVNGHFNMNWGSTTALNGFNVTTGLTPTTDYSALYLNRFAAQLQTANSSGFSTGNIQTSSSGSTLQSFKTGTNTVLHDLTLGNPNAIFTDNGASKTGLQYAATGYVTQLHSLVDKEYADTKQAAGNYITDLTGDVTANGPGSSAATLATVNSNVGTFGSATQSLTATVNGKGLITAMSAQTVTPAIGSITGLGTGVATALGINTGSTGSFVVNGGGLGTPSSGTLTNATGLPLTTGVTGVLPIANGGTGLNSIGANNTFLRSNGTSLAYNDFLIDTRRSFPMAQPNVPIDFFGDSYTQGSGATTTSRTFFSIVSNLVAPQATSNNYGLGGTGWLQGVKQAYTNVSPGTFHTVIATLGFNDVRRNGNTVTCNPKTIEKLKSGARALIANSWLVSAVAANNGSVTTTGTWGTTSGIFDKASSNLSGLVRTSTVSGSTLTYTVSTSNYQGLVIGTFSTDEVTTFGGDFTYTVDGGSPITYTGKNKTDGISDGTYDNSIIPNAIIITGLTEGSHTIVVTTTSTATVRIDYFGVLQDPKQSYPVLINSLALLDATGYAVSPAFGNDAIMAQGSAALESVVNELPSNYPVYYNDFNRFTYVGTDLISSHLHPNDLGYYHYAESVYSAFKQNLANGYTSYAYNSDNYGWIQSDANNMYVGVNQNPTTLTSFNTSAPSARISLNTASGDSYISFLTGPTNNATPTENVRINKNGVLLVGGITTPVGTEILTVKKDQNASTSLRVDNATSNTAARGLLTVSSGATNISLAAHSAGWSTSGIAVANAATASTNMSAGFNIGTTSSSQLSFWTTNTEAGRFLSTGEFLVGKTTLDGSELVGFRKDQNAQTQLVVTNGTSGTAGRAAISVSTGGTGNLSMFSHSAGYTTSGMNVASTSVLSGTQSGGLNIGTTSGQLSLWTNNTQAININSSQRTFFGGSTSATALVHLAAGTASASTAPLKFTTGTSLTTAEAGAMEYTTDDLFFTISTGTARKRFLFADASGGLTSGRVPVATTNGRLLDYSVFTHDGTRLSPQFVTLAAGTTSNAPLLLTSGTNLTSVTSGAVEFDGTNYFGSASTTRYTFAKTLTNTATLDFGSTAAGAATDLTITVTGAADGDPVSIGVPNGSTLSDGSFSAWVSASNTVTVRFTNNSLTLTLDPASGTFRASVIKY